LVAFAVVNELGVDPAPDTGSLREDLVAVVETLRIAFSGILGQALAGLISDMAHDPDLAELIRRDVLGTRRRSMRAALVRGERRGEIAAGLDIDLILDMLTAPYYLRTLFGHARNTARTSEKLVDYVLSAASP
jgi:hypothetical protein